LRLEEGSFSLTLPTLPDPSNAKASREKGAKSLRPKRKQGDSFLPVFAPLRLCVRQFIATTFEPRESAEQKIGLMLSCEFGSCLTAYQPR
jgi:hypothetical protein